MTQSPVMQQVDLLSEFLMLTVGFWNFHFLDGQGPGKYLPYQKRGFGDHPGRSFVIRYNAAISGPKKKPLNKTPLVWV